jgi:hypothetical protein
VKGLEDIMHEPDGFKLLADRMDQIDMTKSFLNTVMIDADQESLTKLSSPVGGLSELVDKLIQVFSAVSEYPVTLLMGESPAGLNATGASDIRLYYDSIHAKQETKLQSPLETLCKWIQLCKAGEFHGTELESWKVVFQPLYEMSETEVVNNKKTTAETDKIYTEMGALYETEVRRSRFGGDAYSHETVLDEALTSAMDTKIDQEVDEIKNPPADVDIGLNEENVDLDKKEKSFSSSGDKKSFLSGQEDKTKED